MASQRRSVGDQVFLALCPLAAWFRPESLPAGCLRPAWRCGRLAAAGALRSRTSGDPAAPWTLRTEYQRINQQESQSA